MRNSYSSYNNINSYFNPSKYTQNKYRYCRNILNPNKSKFKKDNTNNDSKTMTQKMPKNIPKIKKTSSSSNSPLSIKTYNIEFNKKQIQSILDSNINSSFSNYYNNPNYSSCTSLPKITKLSKSRAKSYEKLVLNKDISLNNIYQEL